MIKKLLFSIVALTAALASNLSFAQSTTIANTPLNTGGVSIVRPNILMLLDDSGSMTFQFTPDFVGQNQSGLTALLCDKGATAVTGTSASARLSSISERCPMWTGNGGYKMFMFSPNTDAAAGNTVAPFLNYAATNSSNGNGGVGYRANAPTPPAYSPDINLQYYNPEFRYLPPIKANLTYYPSMTRANSNNWTQVPLDGFGVLSALANTYNVTAWPSVYYCNAAGDSCAHDTSYNFPEVPNGASSKILRVQPNANGTAIEKAAFGAPYYYRLAVSQYCSDEALSACVNSTSPTGNYVFPALVRYCKDTDKAICNINWDPDRGYIVPSYIHVPDAANVGNSATVALTVSSFTASNVAKVTSFKINNVEVAPGAGLTLNASNANNTANAIRDMINAQTATTGVSATTTNAVVNIKYNLRSASYNTNPISILSTAEISTPRTWKFTIKNGNNAALVKNNCIRALSINTVPATNILTTLQTPVCNSTTANGKFTTSTINNMITASGVFATPVITTSGNDMVVTFQRATTDAILNISDNSVTCAVPTVASTGATTISGSSCANGATGAVKGAKFNFGSDSPTYYSSASTFGGGSDGSGAYRGVWTKTSIVAGQTYNKSANRNDCAGATCTYDEEMTNFANWFAYYRFRFNSTKSAVGQAFSALNDNYRVGYAALNSTSILGNAPFDLNNLTAASHRSKWYDRLYATSNAGSTPLRAALSRAGRYYGGKLVNGTVLPDPIEYSCQKNYTILVTDGYWNGGGGTDLDGNNMDGTSYDSDLGQWVTNEAGVYDNKNVSGTLADVAQYYYAVDMRTDTSTVALAQKAKNNVPINSKDRNNAQHMNTYTMGLGLSGYMTYRKDYDTASSGDFGKIISGAVNCAWEVNATDVCGWPTPVADRPSAVDDLWHAAVNGRGQYFSARSPKDATEGLQKALSDVVAVTGAAAASATSSPNVTQSDNFIYSSTYQTGYWDGEVVAQRIDYQTGNIIPDIEWRASTQINAQADQILNNPDARTLITYNPSATGTNKSKPFTYSSLTATEQGWFTGRCTSNQLAQCSEQTIAVERRPFADDAQNMVNFLRGANNSDVFSVLGTNFGYLDIFTRPRDNRLGDTVNAIPHYINRPVYTFDFALPGGHETYADYKQRLLTQQPGNQPRPGTLYVAANDGMVHALDGDTGVETFAYVPRTTMPEMWRLADKNYDTRHRYYVDGSPVSMDVTNATTSQWQTILVGGYRKGGNGYYAMDVTDPLNPKVLWEVCNSSALCDKVLPNMGLSYSNPTITRMPVSYAGGTSTGLDGKWVVLVTSGYNNVPAETALSQPTATTVGTGDGKGYLYVLDALTGTTLMTYATGEGTTALPVNLGKVSTLSPTFYFDGTSSTAYAGDVRGNIWRFALNRPASDPLSVRKITTLKDAAGNPQPITTRIELGAVPGTASKPILLVGTGKYLSIDDLSDNSTQSIYGIEDPYDGQLPNPLNTAQLKDAVEVIGNNYLANLRSIAAASTAPQPFVRQTVVDNVTTGVRKINAGAVDWNVKSGWYVDLPDTGERVSLDPSLSLGTLLIASNVVNSATANACEVGGFSWLYQLDYTKGSSIATAPQEAAAYKVPGAIVVGTVTIRLPSGVIKTITTTASGVKIPYGLNVSTSGQSGKAVSWREIAQ